MVNFTTGLFLEGNFKITMQEGGWCYGGLAELKRKSQFSEMDEAKIWGS